MKAEGCKVPRAPKDEVWKGFELPMAMGVLGAGTPAQGRPLIKSP